MSRLQGSARLVIVNGAALLAIGSPCLCMAQRPAPKAEPAPADATEAEDRRERVAMERFLSLLEKNPRRGTALDKVYGYHVERGTLDAFVKTFEQRAAKAPDDGTGWLLLGLFESQRGRDAAAVNALRKAESTRPDDPMPSYYLGQALVLVGQPEEAAAAFERALERKPKRNDLLEIFQALGRVYQRAQRPQEAMAVWGRLETLFPDDPRVREQIASSLAEEGQADQALPRYEALARSVKDPFRQAQLAMTAADLKVRLGKTEPALREFEALLSKLRPESWLYREVRRKIDEVFLRNDDQAGLASYYEGWVKKNPEDVEALVRLGRSLAAQGRIAEARTWYEKAVKLAPTRRELRLALIGQLVQDQKFADAAGQYEAMDKAEPNNPDTLRDWGGMLLRDKAKPEAERKAAAAAVWRRLLDARPKDPVTAAQVADLFRQADMSDDAIALYRKAIDLAPADAQYREYLGEYLHTQKRSDEALAVWSKIAEGANRDAKNLTRLAEVLAGFGYLKQAVPPLTEAVALDPKEFNLRLKLADLLHRGERFDEVNAQLDAAESLAENDEERSAALEARVKNDLAAGKVAERVEQLRKELDASQGATAARWARLARYLEADGKLPEASAAADRAIAAEPRSVPAWALAARVRESAGRLGNAADAFRRLAEIDRRNRTEYLTGVAKLEARLGQTEQALKAGRDLIAAAPGNPEHYEFFAGLCFQLGRNDEGLDALRRAVRVNPNETKIILTLAETLAGQFRTEEAVEMYWRAFEKSTDLDGKLGIISRLTELYLQRNQFDRLLGRLQREQAEGQAQQQQREVAICLAQAYASSGDLGMARSELERLLSANARDTQLLQQLSKLAEEEGDVESAAKYQKQLNELAPTDEGATRLAQLYVRFGDVDEAQAIWSKMAAGQKETHRVLQALDSLIGNDKPKAVQEIAEAMVLKDPRDWEALYRQSVATANLPKPDDAARLFRALLDLRLDDDEKSAIVKARKRDPKLQASGARPSRLGQPQTSPLEDRINNVQQIRMATGLESRANYSVSRVASASWAPPDFGQARMAALGWVVNLARKQGSDAEAKVLDGLRAAKDKVPRDLRALWDWYYICAMRQEYGQAYEAARDLSRAAPSDPTALWVYLTSLGQRQYGPGPRYYVQPGTELSDGTPPLPPDEIDHALACYRAIQQRRPDLVQGQVVNNLSLELKRAKRGDDGDHLYRDAVETADQLGQIASIFGIAGQRGDVDALIRLFDKYDRLQSGQVTGNYISGNFYFAGPGNAMSQAMSVRAGAKAYDDVLRLLDRYLASARRRQEQQAGRPNRANRFGNPYPAGYAPSYQVWAGKTTNQVRISFPLPNEYYDSNAILLLRTAYELYKRDDLLSDLAAHFRKPADAAQTPADAVYPRLALSYLAWWDDDKDAAITEFTKVAEASKTESDLRLVLAELHEQRGEPADALALVDDVTPLDNATMQRREEQALRLAVLTGNLGRARQAAERLFGLRLDTDTQVRLAGQMHQLGMHELAESVLARARRRAGGKAAALVGLMLQYQRQSKTDVAVQVALQILRSSNAVRNSNPYVYNPNDPDAARNSAVQVLARSGRLKEMITRVQEQLRRAPNAIQLHQALADYYKADGQRDKAREETEKIAALRPDDAGLRYQIATQLMQEGQAAQALPHYKAALQKEPALYSRNYWQVENAFRQANKIGELLQIFEGIDLRSLGQSYYVTNLIQNAMNEDGQRDLAMSLFRKAWEAFPQDRMELISYIRRDEFWQLPESYRYAREALLPTLGAYSPGGQWGAFQNLISYQGDGRINSTISRVLDLAASQNKLDELAGEVEEARKKNPDWLAGKATLALMRARNGRFDEARATVRELLDRHKEQPIGSTSLWVIGNELENHGPLRDLATTVYEACLSGGDRDANSGRNLEWSPVKRLITIYQREGRKDDARRALLDWAKPQENDQGYPDEYIRQMRVQNLTSVARQLATIGFAAEAVPFYSEAAAAAAAIGPDEPNYIGNLQNLVQQARDGLDAALHDMEAGQSEETVLRLLKPEPEKAKEEPKGGGAGGAAPKASRRDQAVDLALLVHPRDLDKAAVRSVYAESLAACARAPEQLKRGEATLDELCGRFPDDSSVRTASALAALAGGDRDRIKEALEALTALMERQPLEQLPAGARANARQRAEAARQLPLWLVARACWGHPDSAREYGDRFAARALDAARRQADSRWTLAMLRERGQHALDVGDKDAAAAAWGQMLDQVLAREVARKRPGTPARAPAPAPAPAAPAAPQTKAAVRRTSFQAPLASPAPAVPAPAPASGPADGVPILTVERFEQAMQVAKLAANQGLFPLSFRAVRESLSGGPPVPVAPKTSRNVVVRNAANAEPADKLTPRVIALLVEVEGIWRSRKAPADEAYEALCRVAMPDGRASELFLYAQPLNAATVKRPRNLGETLVWWAARAGKLDDLRRRVEARSALPMAELPAAVLLAQIELAGGTPEAANAALRGALDRLKKNTLRTTAELACHVALPALRRPDTTAAALAVLDLALKTYQGSEAQEPYPSLLTIAARRQLETGDVEGGRKRLGEYLDALDRSYTNYYGDYPVYLRKQGVLRVAAEFARAGLWTDTLDLLGRFVDAPAYSGGDPPVGSALVLLARQLAQKPAKERYETLKTWTMPAVNRRVVRLLAALGARDEPPDVFAKTAAKDGAGPGSAGDDVVGTATLLIGAAREAGALDALAAEAAAAADQKVENAEVLHTLIELARGKVEGVRPRIEARVDALVKETETRTDPNNQNRPLPAGAGNKPLTFPWADYLVARSALAQDDPALRDLGLKLADALVERARKVNQYAILPRLYADVAAAKAAREGSNAVLNGRDGGLDHWHPTGQQGRFFNAFNAPNDGGPAPWWVAAQGHVAHLSGTGQDFLLFDYPLAGTYEVSVDVYDGAFAQAALSHNGLVIEPSAGFGQSQLYPVGGSETLSRVWKLSRPDDFNRMTVKVEPGKVRYLVNGHLFHEDDAPSPTSPWLGLFTRSERQAAWRNLTVSGNPTIPREVRLSHADRLDGWVSAYYNETQPHRLTTSSTDQFGNPTMVSARHTSKGKPARRAPVNPDDYDWSSKDGVIRGRRLLSPAQAANPNAAYYPGNDADVDASAAVQSRLYYFRPLRDGETVAYEFYYEPDQVLVHPSVDRLAFLLQPEGVRLHWMTAPSGDASGLPSDNVADEPGNRRGPKALPLLPGEWNTMTVALAGGVVTLALNGQEVYQRPLEPANGRQFGFYHDKDRTSVQVRNVVLRGNWPEAPSPERVAELASFPRPGQGTEADRRARHDVIGERFLALEAGDVLRKAEGLGPAKRTEYLAGWVLPSPDHPAFRLQGEFTPTDPVAPAGGPETPSKEGAGSARVLTGGALRAPALELVDSAAAAGKLDELAARVEKADAEGDVNARGKLAMLALLAMARGDDAKAGSILAQLKPLLDKLPPGQPLWARWPELVAASRAVECPALRAQALAMLDVMVDQEQKKSAGKLWASQVKHARARGRLLAKSEPVGAGPNATHWAAVTHARADTRGPGHPVPTWTHHDGEFTHHPGHANDLLYLGVPLRGDFQLDGELTTFNWREIRVTYGGQAVGPKYDLKHLQRTHFGRPLPEITLNPPLDNLGDRFQYRLVVKGSSMTAFVNGRQVYQASLPAERDPWLALDCDAPLTGSARNLKITGRPTVPEQLNLSALPDLTGWLADEYGGSVTGDNPDWDKRGDEIVGRRRDDLPGSKQESVLRYHRPLLEDGEIAYEFYYEPSEAVTHPAVGRLTLLLEPDGVKVHRLTDAQYERAGLTPENAEPDPDGRRGPASLPLKPKEWNRAVLALTGDRLSLRLNGELVFERALEPTNQRLFGLFHYADETEARVRNLTYRGQWPHTLPPSLVAPDQAR
jgi:tetratricopeptide (TPR) repeat protein